MLMSQIPTYPFAQKHCGLNGVKARLSDEMEESRFIPLEFNLTGVPVRKNGDHSASSSPSTSFHNYPNLSSSKDTGQSVVPADSGTVHKAVYKAIKEILYFDEDDINEIDEERNLFELGLSSITIVEFVHALNREFHLNLPETIVFDYVTIGDLAKFVLTKLNSKSSVIGNSVRHPSDA